MAQDFTHLRGRLLDLDSHVHGMLDRVEEIVGPKQGRRARHLLQTILGRKTIPAEQPLTAEDIFTAKGEGAPGRSREGRLGVLDRMGVRSALIFPDPIEHGMAVFGEGPDFVEAMRCYNDWISDYNSADPERLRGVALLNTWSIATALDEVDRVLRAGGRGFLLPHGNPPGGVSPADPTLDPLWSRLAESDVPLFLHVGGEAGFQTTDVWGSLPHLQLSVRAEHAGEPIGPYWFTTLPYAVENFLSALVLGGVFERHPRLRCGVIELGAYWFGPLCERLDLTAEIYAKRMTGALSMRPSEYLRRNVRVTPYFMEPLDVYVRRYAMQDVLCFSTDYPHKEGGTRPLEHFAGPLSRLDADMTEKFLVTNGGWVMPS